MARDWKPGDVILDTTADYPTAYLIGDKGFMRLDDGQFTPYGNPFVGPEWFNEQADAWRPLVVIDPEDRKAIETHRDRVVDYLREWGHEVEVEELASALQAALRDLADPKPEVFRHFVLDSTAKPVTSLCGKVWEFSADVIDKGACPECSRLAGNSGWLA